jgi:universal stress protein E
VDSPKNALVIVDKPKHEQTAVMRALALQKLAGGHMHLAAFAYHAMYDQKDIFETHQRRAIRKEIERQRTQWLRDLVLDSRAAFSDLTLEVVWTKDIAAWVAEQIPTRGYDLVIKSINQSQTLTHTPLDWELLRTTPCPVLLCTSTPWQRKPVVLAAVDLRTPDRAHEALNHRVLSAARVFANLHGGVVHCAYAIDVPKVLSELNIEDPREFQRETQHDVQARLKAFAATYDIPEKNVHVPMGKVGHAMNRLSAKLKADLMVMGTTARKGLKGLVIGNSAEKVLIKARCDVLALKP